MGNNDANTLLEIHLGELGIEFEREYRFAPPRRWRFDYALHGLGRVAIEIEGGIFSRGRHTRGAGYEKDLEKYRAATRLDWKVYRFSTGEVLRGVALDFFKAELSSS